MGRPKRKTAKVKQDVDDSPKKGIKRKAAEIKVEPDEDKAGSSKDVEKQEKVVTFSGKVPLDTECPLDPKEHHVIEDGDCVYNAMLNQTNINANNNKYFILQLIRHNCKPDCYAWFRWGRVGKVAGTTLSPQTKTGAIVAFKKKFKDKTGCFWDFRDRFQKVKGKYDLVKIDYGQDQSSTVVDGPKKPKVEVESKLDKRLQDVMKLIFDTEEWEATIKEMKFDVEKAPLGKLTSQQITAGYQSLKKIESCIDKNDFGDALNEACSEFYTRVPHDFGMKKPPLMKTSEELKEKLQLLEALEDIQVAIKVVDEKRDDTKNSLDYYYESLNCDLVPLEKSDKEFKDIEKYLKNTHGKTHYQYGLAIDEIFRVHREADSQRFKGQVGNRMLLWHGSRLTNWCGILKQGLRIAPPEAPVTGYMFGKGVYFADMVSKSANYCHTSLRQPIGFLLVCEVALGKMNEKSSSDYNAANLPKGYHSTKGLGKSAPDPKQFVNLNDGAVIPSGKPKQVAHAGRACLLYNEFIVYDVAQIKPRYLVKAKFKY